MRKPEKSLAGTVGNESLGLIRKALICFMGSQLSPLAFVIVKNDQSNFKHHQKKIHIATPGDH